MKTLPLILVSVLVLSASMFAQEIPNPKIDYPGFLKDAEKVGELREKRRITEEEFLRMMKDPGVVVLDARSAEKYALLHIRGAVNLSLPDFTEAELAKIIPSKTTKVLIYCNNNFDLAPVAFPGKALRVSLNIYTFNNLYGYGYTNVYELGPYIDIQKSKLPFVGKKQ